MTGQNLDQVQVSVVVGTFVDQEAGVDQQPVAVLVLRLQRQCCRQLVLQEGQRHALLQLVGGGGQAGRQPTGTAGGQQNHNRQSQLASEKSEVPTLNSYLRLRPCMTASGPNDTGASWEGRQLLKSAHWTRESPLSATRVLRQTEDSSQGQFTRTWGGGGLRCSPGLQRRAEAVGLPVGQSHHGDTLLGQQGL